MWVFCAGMMRSGSTLQYQIAKTLVEGAGQGIGIGSCTPGRFRELLDRHDDPRQVYVVKCHRYLPTAHGRLRRGEARALYIYRDLRDVVVSMMHKKGRTFRQMVDAGFVEQLLEDDAVWSAQPNTLVSVYEEVMTDVRAEVERIAAFLGIEVEGAELARIADEHSLSRQSRRIQGFDFGQAGVAEGQTNLVDPDTLLHHNHVRSGQSGQWAEELVPAEVVEIERVAGPWLLARGYELSGGGGRPGPAVRVRAALERVAARAARRLTDLRFAVAPTAGALTATVVRPARRLSDALTSSRLAVTLGSLMYRLGGRRPRGGSWPLAEARRVLVVRLDDVAGVVLTGPLLRELRRNVPNAEITLVVTPAVQELVERCPYVDRVLTYEPAVSGPFGRLKRHARALAMARRHLWPLRLDLALFPRGGEDRHHGAFLTYFSGAVRRIGYADATTGRNEKVDAVAHPLFTRTLPPCTSGHDVEWSLGLLRALGGQVRDERLELWLDEMEEAEARRMLDRHGLGAEAPLVAFGVGAPFQRAVWPIPRYAEAARVLRDRHRARVLILGSDETRGLAESLHRQADGEPVNLVGRASLRQTAALLRHCDLYVGNDAGVMQLAAAAGVPVVQLSCHPRTGRPEHADSPVRFGPWQSRSRVLQPDRPLPPCTGHCAGGVAHCITSVSVEQVLDAAEELL